MNEWIDVLVKRQYQKLAYWCFTYRFNYRKDKNNDQC